MVFGNSGERGKKKIWLRRKFVEKMVFFLVEKRDGSEVWWLWDHCGE